jgi:hydrogenase maturation protein HypF
MPGNEPNSAADVRRWRCSVSGQVQGVGFRPFVSGLARSLALTGFVGNDRMGVFVEVQGPAEALREFAGRLSTCPPPAVVEAVAVEELRPERETAFQIAPSAGDGGGPGVVPTDLAPCDHCLREFNSPGDRRFHYPLVACSRCGPRFTLIRGMPFDRANTTMPHFPMCPDCTAEYETPADYRFHAQTIACPECGPRFRFEDRIGPSRSVGPDAVEAARRAITDGRIVAVKGVGGFHLVCDATNDAAVRRLRSGKGRGDKPFALMAASAEMIRRYAVLGSNEEKLLAGPERPIVLLHRGAERSAGPLSPAVAPGSPCLGFMLPYTPLHHLLLSDRPLVMTSGNGTGEPIVTSDADAERLSPPADALLLHDREIVTPCDDSVVREFEGGPYPIRRSRGYVPLPVRLAGGGRTVLAVGGELKAAFCLAVGDRAYLSQHIGDLSSPATLAALDRAVRHLTRLLGVRPEVVACDAHPDYLSARWAARFAAEHRLPLVRVQHHRAHALALTAEHRHAGPLIGVCFDGTGYGDDGAAWGGEVFHMGNNGFARVAHLDYVSQPGGDAAVERPYRMGLAHLWAAGIDWDEALPCVRACPPAERVALRTQLGRTVNCVPTSSVGRLFDAIAAVAGVRQSITYEGQAAIELEAVAVETPDGYNIPVGPGGVLRLDPRPLFQSVARDLGAGVPAAVIAGRFHRGLAAAVVEVCRTVGGRTGTTTVGLTGGVFQNMTLLRLAVEGLRHSGFHVLVHRQVPANDGGISLGQAVAARGTG